MGKRVEIEDGRYMDSSYFETPVMALDSIPPDEQHYPFRRKMLDEVDFWVGFVAGVIFRSIFRSK